MTQKPTPDDVLARYDNNPDAPYRDMVLVEALRAALAQRDEASHRAAGIILTHECTIANVQVQLAEAQAKRKALEEGLSNSEHWHGLVCKERDELLGEASQLQAQLAEARAKLLTQRMKRAELVVIVSELEAKLASVEKERDEYISRNGLLASNTLDADSQVTALQAQLAEALAQRDEEVAFSIKYQSDKRRLIDDANDMLTKLQAKFAEAQSKVEQIGDRLATTLEQLAEAQEKLELASVCWDHETKRADESQAKLASAVKALREISDSQKFAEDTAIKRSYKLLQDVALEALAALDNGKEK